jgi:hypothetical protein
MATLTVELPDRLFTEVNSRLGVPEQLNALVRTTLETWLMNDSPEFPSHPQVTATQPTLNTFRPIQQAEFFGMWADRQDLPQSSSASEWLEHWRTEQWRGLDEDSKIAG